MPTTTKAGPHIRLLLPASAMLLLVACSGGSSDSAGDTVAAHLTSWPVGRYHKAHHHLGGAILYGLQSDGYVLIWPQEAGSRPYGGGQR